MRVAACQLNSKDNKEENIRIASRASRQGRQLWRRYRRLPEYTDFMGDNAGALAAMETS